MPQEFDPIFHGGDTGGQSPSFPDLSFRNERALWWAEFDTVGEEAIRGYVERNAYSPTGMEIARQWLAQREFRQLREDVQSIKALAEQAQESAAASLRNASEALTKISLVDANSRPLVEIAARARKNARIATAVATAASVLALCAIVMVLVTWRQVAPPAKQASAHLPRPIQAVARPASPSMTSPVSPAAPSPALPAETRQALAALPQDAQRDNGPNAPPFNAPPIASPDLKPEGPPLAETLALIADKVGGEGPINFTAQFRDMTTGRDHSEALSYQTSNVTIDPNRCQVGYHWHAEQDGRPISDQDRTIEFRLAKNVWMTSIDAESSPRFSVLTQPKVHVVHIARWDNASGDTLYFHDKTMAARVGTAARRAMERCDNGSQQVRRR